MAMVRHVFHSLNSNFCYRGELGYPYSHSAINKGLLPSYAKVFRRNIIFMPTRFLRFGKPTNICLPFITIHTLISVESNPNIVDKHPIIVKFFDGEFEWFGDIEIALMGVQHDTA